MSLQQSLVDLFIVCLIAALTPILVGLLPRLRVPQVVIFILGGILVGPQVLGWAAPEGLELISNVGLGFLFLLAGYELELGLFRERAGRLALTSWLVTAVVAVAVTGALAAVGFVRAFVPIAIGLTTTALGTLLPILRDNRMLEGRFRCVHHGCRSGGGVPPHRGRRDLPQHPGRVPRFALPDRYRGGRAAVHVRPAAGSHTRRSRGSSPRVSTRRRRLSLRWTMVLLFALLVIAADFGLDVVLGAFLAGVVLRRWAPGDVHSLEAKLDAVGYGFFIPVFFVTSGMSLDLKSIIESPARLVVFFVLFLAVRGLPALLFYRRDLPMRGRVQLMLLTATALPLLVALAAIGLESGTMLPENAAALVGAGVLSVMVFPPVAVILGRSGAHPLVETPDRDVS